MTFFLQDVLDHVVSHCMTTGYFTRVNQHEPKNPPGQGLTCSVWLKSIRPAKSGLDSVSLTVLFTVRIFQNMLVDPLDDQDPTLSDAASALWANLAGDCMLDDSSRCVDLFGMEGQPLTVETGYVEQDKKMYRIYDLTVPVIINDAFTITP